MISPCIIFGSVNLFQTLIFLDLSVNEIHDIGAKYLADALDINRVRQWLFSSLLSLSLYVSVDTEDSDRGEKLYRTGRRKGFTRCCVL